MTLILKGFGLITVFSVCMLLGFSRASRLALRARYLEELICRIRELGQYLRFEGSERIKLVDKIFADCEFIAVENGDITVSTDILTTQDKKLIEDFFSRLGSTDTQSECERVELYVGLLSAQQTEAAGCAAQKGKLYRTMGICIGIAGCLLLI